MTISILAQKEIEKLVKIAVVEHPIDIVKFTSLILKEILPKVKNELGIEFDELRVYPGPQPIESSDIELIANGVTVGRLNQKTCISGNIYATVRKLKRSIRMSEDGLIVLFVLFKDKTEKEHLKIILIYIPHHVVKETPSEILGDIIEEKIQEKVKKEGYVDYHILEVTSAIALWRAREVLLTREVAEQALNEAKKAFEEAKKAREVAEQALNEAKKAREVSQETQNLVKELMTLVKKYFEEEKS